MPDDTQTIVLPPLTPEELLSRDHQESKLDAALSKCWDLRGKDFDNRRALDFVRTYAIEIFELQLTVYRQRHWYTPQWIPKIIEEAIHRVLIRLKNHTDNDGSNLRPALAETILTHMQRSPILAQHANLAKLYETLANTHPVISVAETSQSSQRVSAQVDCRPAAVLIESYIRSKAISLTELATQAQTTDRTLRRLRKEGRIHRDILRRLADVMGVSIDKLIG